MPNDNLRKLIEAELSGARSYKFGRTQRAGVTPAGTGVDDARGKGDRPDRPSGIGQLQRIGRAARAAAAGEARDGTDEMVDPSLVITMPLSPTEAADVGTRPGASDGNEGAAPTAHDEDFVYGEEIDRKFVLVAPPATRPDGGTVAPVAHDETVEEEGGTVAALAPDAPASPGDGQVPAAGPAIRPSQAVRNAIPGIKDSLRSDPRSARIQLPENLSVEHWKQKGTYAKLVLNKTGVSAVLRDVEDVFKETPMADDVVDELESVARPGDISQGGRDQLDAKYARLTQSIQNARQGVESTLKTRAKLLPSEYRDKIETMISDLSSLEGRVEGRRALLVSLDSVNVIASAKERQDIPRFLGQEEQFLPGRIEKIQNLLAACSSLRGVLQAFRDNNPYRGICNIQNLLDKIEFHHPEMANIARTRAFSQELRGTYLWTASIAPQAENLRQMVAAKDPGFERKRRQIQEAAQAKLESIRLDIEGQHGLASGSRPTKTMEELESRIKSVKADQATMLERMEEDISIDQIPDIKNIVDNARTELIAYNTNARRLFAVVRQQMDAATYLPPGT